MKRSTITKLLLPFLVLIVFTIGLPKNSIGQLFTETFNYTAHATNGINLQSAGAWVNINSGDSIIVESGSLSYPGFAASTGNKITYGGSGTDAYRAYTSQTTGTVYCSFLLNIPALGSLNSTGGYPIGFIDNTTTTFASTLWIRSSGSNFNIGVNPRTTAANTAWLSNTLTTGTTYLVVIATQIVAGTTNDISKIWLNPTSLGGSEPTASATATNTGTDLTSYQRILLRQDGSTATPGTMQIDEMRVGTTWASVTPSGATPTITATGTLNALSTTYGTATAIPDSFTVSGADMSAGILVTPPSGFEVSQSYGSGYGATTTVGSSGTIATTKVYIRISSTATVAGSPYSGNVVCSSSGATSVNVATASSTVSVKTLTISGLSVTARQYNGGTTATIAGTATLNGVVNSDNTTLSGTASGVYADANASVSAITVNVNGFSLSGSTSSNYTLGSPQLVLSGFINKADQTITFGALASKYDTSANFQLTASASSGLPVSYISSNTSIATIISPDSVDLVGSGLDTITASQAGNSNYNAATSVSQPLTVISTSKSNQTINFAPISNKIYGGGNFQLTASATSSLPVSYASSNTSVATIVGGDSVHIVGVGTTTITASQSGDGSYNPAPDSAVSLTVEVKPLTVATATAQNKPYDGTDTAYITGVTFNESLVGSDVVTATGGGNFADAEPDVTKSVTAHLVLNGADASKYTLTAQPTGLTADITIGSQTITFPPTFTYTYGVGDVDFTDSATSSAGVGYPVTYAIDNASVGYFVGNTLTIIGAGTANIIASQPGDGYYYDPAPDDTAVLTVNKATQTITGFASNITKLVGDAPFNPGATATSGLTVGYISTNTAVATVSGSTITIVAAGTTSIRAIQDGDDNYFKADTVTRTLTVNYPSIFANAITDANPSAANPFNAGQTYDAGLTVNGITRSSGLTAASSANRFSASNWNTTTSLGTTKYMEFTLTPVAGKKIDFDKFIYTRQASSTGPATFSLRSSLDNYSTDIFVKTGTNNVTGTDTVSLSAATYQGIKDTIRFRIYGYNAGATGGTGSINDFDFKGLVGCYTPTAYTVGGGGAYCGTTPKSVTLSGSQSGVSYQLKKDGVDEGTPLTGTGSTLAFGGLTTDGVYTIEASNTQSGCNTSLTMNGSVSITTGTPNSSTTNTDICSSSLPYIWNGVTTYLGDTTYTVTLTNASGCDSAATLNLTVKYATSSNTYDTICSSALPYSWNSQSFGAGGLHTVHFTNAAGCDSAANLYLTVKDTSTSTTDIAICSTQLPYTWNGVTTYVDDTTYTVHLTNAVGCDSAATLNLTVSAGVNWANLQWPLTHTMCQNDSVEIYGQVYDPGVTDAGGQGAGITVEYGYNATNTNPSTWTTWTAATYNVDFFNNDEYKGKLKNLSAGTYYYAFRYKKAGNDCYQYGGTNGFWNGTTNISGVLTVKATSTSTSNISICSESLPYTWNGVTTYNDDTTYTVHLSNSVGCDSAATLNLTVSSASSSTNNDTICSTQLPYTWNGVTTYLGDTTYTVHLSNVGGCDSAATLNLTVKLASSSVTDTTICSTQLPFTWNSITTYLDDTTYTVHLTNAVGCDSAVTLNLTVLSASVFIKYDTVCSNTLPYMWNDSAYMGTSFGFDTVIKVNAVGCDSLDILRLVVKTAKTTSTSLSICASSLPYTWNGVTTYLGDTTYVVHFTASNGCDSAATLILTVQPLPVISASHSPSTVCAGNNISLITTGDGYGSYSWSGPSGYTSPSIQRLGPITQDFNTLSGTTWSNNSTLPNWYILQGQGNTTSPATATTALISGTGSGTNQGAYNFATAGAPSDHALGSIAGNTIASSGSMAYFYGIKIVNTSGYPVNSATIEYTGEQYRNAGVTATQQLLVDYSYNASSLTNASGSWINIPDLTFVSPIHTATAAAVDGNSGANRQVLTKTITGILLPAGDSMWVRWSDLNDSGNDHGLAIDDVSITLFGTEQNPTISSATTGMSGTYTVTVTSKAGCVDSAQTIVSVGSPTSSLADSSVCSSAFPFTWNGHEFTGTESGVEAHFTNAAGCDSTVTMNVTSVVCNSYLNVTAVFQGYYDMDAHRMRSVLSNVGVSANAAEVDTVTLELRDGSNGLVASAQGVMDTTGLVSVTLPPVSGNYYIVVKHRGSVETWSADSVAFTSGGTTNYNFTSGATQAYGENMIEVDGKWAIYSGELDGDAFGSITLDDYNVWETSNNAFDSGYVISDLDGEGNVTLDDYNIWETNSNNFVGKVSPF